jgi:hypothetical protein
MSNKTKYVNNINQLEYFTGISIYNFDDDVIEEIKSLFEKNNNGFYILKLTDYLENRGYHEESRILSGRI